MNNNKQHYRMTLEELIAHYKCGLISSTALLYYFLRIRLAPGWKMTLHQREISEHLGISKTTFYKGIQRLKDKKLIDWEAPNGLVISIGQIGDSLDKSGTVGQIGDSLDKSGTPLDKSGTPLDKSGTPLDKSGTGTPPQSPRDKAPSTSSNSYQIFINSLSNSEREKFLNFVRKQIKNFTKPINDVEAWLASKNKAGKNRWEVYYQNFLSAQKKSRGSRDLENFRAEIEKQRQQWKEEI